MKDKWNRLETFHKSFILSLILSMIVIGICTITLIIDTSYLYGALLGAILLVFSYLVIWILWYKIPNIQTTMAKSTSLLSPMIRIIIYITFYLIVLFAINDLNVFQPINTFTLLIVYTITPIGYVSTGIVDHLFREKEEV